MVTLNQRVVGSSPTSPTKEIKDLDIYFDHLIIVGDHLVTTVGGDGRGFLVIF